MFQWFLRIVQIGIVALFLYADYDANISDGKPMIALIGGAIMAFGATQAILGIKWLLDGRKRRASRQ